MEELPEQTIEEQEEAQAAVLGDVDELPIVEGGTDVNFTQYEGLRVKIESVRQEEVIDWYTGPEKDGKPSYNPNSTQLKRVIVVETEPLPKMENGQITNETLKVGTGENQREYTVKAKFNLKKREDGTWAISKAPAAKLWKFMRKLGASVPSQMKGKLVTLTTVADRDESSDKRWPRIVI